MFSCCLPCTCVASENEDASEPRFIIHRSKLYLIWVQANSSGKQIRIAYYNDNDENPVWKTVDRFDGYGPSVYGLNYNLSQNASNPVLASNGRKLYALWSEIDNNGKLQLRVVENPM